MNNIITYKEKDYVCYTECNYTLYRGEKPKIGSVYCKAICQYNKKTDTENKTVECSYEYDHLSEEEQKVIYENI